MSTIEITRVEDVREGDVVTLSYNGHEITGPAYWDGAPDNRVLRIGPLGILSILHGSSRRVLGAYPFIRATRELLDLPTELGSVIVNATIRGTEGVTAFLTAEGDVWYTDRETGDGYWWANPEHITAWEPARIVAEGDRGVAR